MNCRLIDESNRRYVECTPSERLIASEQDALDLIAACMEYQSNLLMIHGEALSEDFFRLSTGVAGAILQKLVNYHVKTAAIISDSLVNKGRFREMALEANKSSHFRIFNTKKEAENWLTSGS